MRNLYYIITRTVTDVHGRHAEDYIFTRTIADVHGQRTDDHIVTRTITVLHAMLAPKLNPTRPIFRLWRTKTTPKYPF